MKISKYQLFSKLLYSFGDKIKIHKSKSGYFYSFHHKNDINHSLYTYPNPPPFKIGLRIKLSTGYDFVTQRMIESFKLFYIINGVSYDNIFSRGISKGKQLTLIKKLVFRFHQLV